MTPLLSVSDLVAYRDEVALFSPTNFAVRLGDCLRITGRNGAGKTTLLECIAGLYDNWSGSIHRPPGKISYLQQTSRYVRTLPLLKLSRLVDGFEESHYRQLVENLDLEPRQNVLLALLSGGELQRARLLLSLLRHHSVLLLDEPFANIDISSCRAIVGELQRTRSHRATLIVTHPHDANDKLIGECLEYALSSDQC